jgi:signal transduction histidine kinase
MMLVDNGIGFDPSVSPQPRAYGLRDLHERVAHHGGVLIIKSAPMRGTEVMLKVPILPTASLSPMATSIG